MVLWVKALPSSIKLYLLELWVNAVTVYWKLSFSWIDTTLHVVGCIVLFSKTQTEFACGAWLNADVTLIVLPLILDIFLVSKVPSGKITDNLGLFVASKSVLETSSTSTAVVDAECIRPPLLRPALTGSLICITCPGLIKTPASAVQVKVQVSVAFCSLYKNHRPNLLACPREVQANAVTFLTTLPSFVMFALVSSTVSKSIVCESMSKYATLKIVCLVFWLEPEYVNPPSITFARVNW